jgi:prevent-host-death family protein
VAIIGVRDLLRDNKDILARVEAQKEPFLITRHGQPVAALVPVDPADAERYILSAAPDLIEVRDEAGAATTLSLDEAARELGVTVPDEEPEAGLVFKSSPSPSPSLRPGYVTYLLGEDAAEQFEVAAAARVDAITAKVIQTAEDTGLIAQEADARTRVHEVNLELFGFALKDATAKTVVGKVMDEHPDGTLTNDVLDTATEYVYDLNEKVLALGKSAPGEFSLAAYEGTLRIVRDALQIPKSEGAHFLTGSFASRTEVQQQHD